MSGSLLDSLAARRAELAAELTTTIPVPLWTHPTLRLRIKPVDHAVIQGITARAEKVKGKAAGEAQLNANAAIVAAATVEVLLGDDDEAAMPLTAPQLAESLGLPEGSHATVVVRALALRDADVISLANAAMRHSGYNELEESFEGE